MLLPYYSIGSDSGTIEAALHFEFSYTFKPVLIGRPDQQLPVIHSREEGKIDPAVWSIKSLKYSGVSYPWVRAEGIIKSLFTRALIRNNRCLVPANGFFIKTPAGIYFIYYPKERVLTLCAICKMYTDPDTRKTATTFSLISRPSHSKLSHLTGRMPLIIRPSDRRKFLKKEIPLMDITRILRKDNNLDVNGTQVNPWMFHKENPTKKDFMAIGNKLYKARPFPEKAILGNFYYQS